MHNSGTLILVGKRFKLFLIVKDKVFNVHSEKSDCIRISAFIFWMVQIERTMIYLIESL